MTQQDTKPSVTKDGRPIIGANGPETNGEIIVRDFTIIRMHTERTLDIVEVLSRSFGRLLWGGAIFAAVISIITFFK